jgi:hypothetical protein
VDVGVNKARDHRPSAEVYNAGAWTDPKTNFLRSADGDEAVILDRHAFFNGKILIDGQDLAVGENYVGASTYSRRASEFHFLTRARSQAYP